MKKMKYTLEEDILKLIEYAFKRKIKTPSKA